MNNTEEQPLNQVQEQEPNQQQRSQPIEVSNIIETVIIVLVLTIKAQSITYADGTEEQTGNHGAELRISLDRETYTDVFPDVTTNTDPTQESI